MYSVYWIHTPDANSFDEGYIGISKNTVARFNNHRYRAPNPHFRYAIIKHGWDNLCKDILVTNLDLESAELIEEMLRPIERLGWNIHIGGLRVPSNKGSKITEEQRVKFSVCKRGLLNPANKLTPENVIDIYLRCLNKEVQTRIAATYSIADTTVAKIKYLRKPYYKEVINNYLKGYLYEQT